MMGSEDFILFSRGSWCAYAMLFVPWVQCTGTDIGGRITTLVWGTGLIHQCRIPRTNDLCTYAEMPGTYGPWVEDVEEVRP